MRDYSVTIKESSSDLTAKEKVLLKQLTGTIRLDEATQGDDVEIKPVGWVVLGIHNEKSEDKDYENYIVIDESGSRFITGSRTFFDTFLDIYEDMQGEDEDWSLMVTRLPSKNYKGKEFLSCYIK